MLFAEGRNVKQVSRWLGHAKASFPREVYVHLMDEGIGDAAFLDAAVSRVVSDDFGGARRGQGEASHRERSERPQSEAS